MSGRAVKQWELCGTSPSLPAPVQEEALLPPQHNGGSASPKGGHRLAHTFVSQDTSGVPSDARAGERRARYTPKWKQREGGWGHRELSPGVAGADSTCPPAWLAQGASGICNSRWTGQRGALHLYMETLTQNVVLPSPLGNPAKGLSQFLLLNKRSSNFGHKALFKFYHMANLLS